MGARWHREAKIKKKEFILLFPCVWFKVTFDPKQKKKKEIHVIPIIKNLSIVKIKK